MDKWQEDILRALSEDERARVLMPRRWAREIRDLIVRTANPSALDETVLHLPGAAAVVDGSYNGDTCRVRCFGNVDYIRFAITSQGYGEVISEEDPA